MFARAVSLAKHGPFRALWLGAAAWCTKTLSRSRDRVEDVACEAEAQSGGSPQNGQCGSCRNNRRASTMRSVAIECGLCRSGRTR